MLSFEHRYQVAAAVFGGVVGAIVARSIKIWTKGMAQGTGVAPALPSVAAGPNPTRSTIK